MTDHDRRAAMILIWLAIAVGSLALAELVYLAIVLFA